MFQHGKEMARRWACAVMVVIMMLAMTASAEDSWRHFLLLGCDSRSAESYERSDSMIVLSVNSATLQVKMVSIMRDTWVEIPGHGAAKINSAVVYGGPELATKVVSESFGLNIERYIMINMGSLVGVIDSLGGIDLEITQGEMKFINEWVEDTLKSFGSNEEIAPLTEFGRVHLNGVQAVTHARNRTIGSDYERTVRQRQVLFAIAERIKGEMSLATLLELAGNMIDSVETNLSLAEIAELAVIAMNVDVDGIESVRIPVEGAYTVEEGDVWRLLPDLEANREALRSMYGSEN